MSSSEIIFGGRPFYKYVWILLVIDKMTNKEDIVNIVWVEYYSDWPAKKTYHFIKFELSVATGR